MKEGSPKSDVENHASAWRRFRLPGGGYAWRGEVDPQIQALMPDRTKTFSQTTAIDLIKSDIKRFLYDLEVTLKGGTTSTPPPEDY